MMSPSLRSHSCWMLIISCWLGVQVQLQPSSSEITNDGVHLNLTQQAPECWQCSLWEHRHDFFCIMAPYLNANYDYLIACSKSLTCTIESYFRKQSNENSSSPIPKVDLDLPECVPESPFPLYDSKGTILVDLVSKAFRISKLKDFNSEVKEMNLSSNSLCNLDYDTFQEVTNESSNNYKSVGLPMCEPYYCECNLLSMKFKTLGEVDTIKRNHFVHLPRTQNLDMSSQGYREADKNAFDLIENLKVLNLSSNSLATIEDGTFEMLQQLEVLDVSGNRLRSTAFQAIRHLHNLNELMMNNNRLSGICEKCLERLLNLTILHLEHNHFKSIQNEFQPLKNLVLLDLSGNIIKTVSESAFHSLVELEVLKLKGNSISTLSDSMFIKNLNLVVLDMSSNDFERFSGDILTENHQLRVLDISNNPLKYIPKFPRLPNLSLLIIQQLLQLTKMLDNTSFCHLQNLEHLRIQDNGLSSISSNAFNCNKKLIYMNFDNNNLRDLMPLQNVTAKELSIIDNKMQYFSMNEIPYKVEKLDLSFNQIKEWREDSSKPVSIELQIRKLVLSDNRLKELSGITIPSSLEILDLSQNRIVAISFHNLSHAVSLMTIDLRVNNLNSIYPHFLNVGIDILRSKLNVTYNKFKCSCEVRMLSNLTEGFKSYFKKRHSNCVLTHPQGQISNFPKGYVDETPFHCPDEKRYCACNMDPSYIHQQRLSCPTKCSCFISVSHDFYVVDCTNRNLSTVPEMEVIQIQSSVILSKNLLTILNSSMLSPFRKAKDLFVNNNYLAHLDANAFAELKNLRLLNLSSNLLHEMPVGIFSELKHLTKIYLGNNKLQEIPDDLFTPLKNLTIIHIHDNALTRFPVWTLRENKLLSEKGISLTGNPWSCECDYFNQFRAWLETSTSLVDNVSNLFCTVSSDGGQNIQLYSFNDTHCDDTVMNIQDNLPLVAGIITVSVVTLAVVASVLVYIYHQEVQVLIYSRYGIRVFQRNKLQDDDKVYDAFVAYSGADQQFVAEQIIPGLEQTENPYRVCVHHRDFLVGAMITESIMEAVDKSCRTIVILSDNFVNSGWCRFEFKTAHNTSLCDRVARLIVVVLGDIPKECDSEMKLYLKTNTYLQWGDLLFWKKLYFALPDRQCSGSKPI